MSTSASTSISASARLSSSLRLPETEPDLERDCEEVDDRAAEGVNGAEQAKDDGVLPLSYCDEDHDSEVELR